MRFTKAELERIKKLLIARRQSLNGFVNKMQEAALNKDREDVSGDFNHMADLGTDNFEQEFTLGLIENEEEELRLINEALAKLDEGTYGLCETCGEPIPKTRLKALPFAKLCIACKEKDETSR
jgi:RNA polymerase-binding protein DksA